jgi:hypothetical protein
MTLAPGEVGYAGYEAGTVLGVWPIDLDDLQLDRVDEYGGLWNVTEFQGRGSPPTSIDFTQRTRGHGAWVGGRYWAAKPYTISGAYEGGSELDRFAAEQRLLQTISTRDVLMTMHEEIDRQTTVVLNGEITIDAVNPFAFTFQLPLIAADPFRYSTTLHELSTGLPKQTGGLVFPAVWPAAWTGVSSSGALSVLNDGTMTAYPTIRVFGPLVDFTLSQPETGLVLRVDLSAYPLLAGEWIDVDMSRERVMLLGTASRRWLARGDFFGLPPGESTVLFGSSTFDSAARIDLSFRTTWI